MVASTVFHHQQPMLDMAGPSSAKKKNIQPLKRKRSAEPQDHLSKDSTPDAAVAKPKKKKANRACVHCQKAHLTCDDSRPCQRCVKRGMEDKCVEGHRKKAKYLLDEEELEALKKTKETDKFAKATAGGKPINKISNQPQVPPHQHQLETPPQNQNGPLLSNESPDFDPLFNMSFDPAYSFGSQAVNMEYSILSAILGNPAADDHNLAPPSPPPSTIMPSFAPLSLSNSAWPSVPQQQSLNQTQLARINTMNGMNFDSTMDASALLSAASPYSRQPTSPELSRSTVTNMIGRGTVTSGLAPPTPPASVPSPPSPAGLNNLGSPELGISAESTRNIQSTGQGNPFGTSSTTKQALAIQHQRSANVYSSVKKPYDYVDGYHYLMQYLQGRFEKNDILRIVRSLAIYRPSLIALQMPLSVEDEVFVEKSFQRTLIELEKLISFSGTPTVIWRRTGEICLVGLEFTMLTEWSRDDLVTNRKFIYELFDHQSVVEYWEKFASHAFENSSQSVYSHCVLLKPNGAPVPCAFCFSIRRDVFDLPSVVIGQWLPLL